jgi:hypothetical protein
MRGVLSSKYRAWLYNMMRDIDEVVFDVIEVVKPGFIGMRTDVVSGNNGEIRLLIDTEAPRYLNITEALLLIRRLIRLVLQMDEGEKIKELEKLWPSQTEEELKNVQDSNTEI